MKHEEKLAEHLLEKRAESEIDDLIMFLKHPAGFNVDFAGVLCIRPTDECCPPETWEVDWTDWDGNKLHQNFDNLFDAATFFIFKRYSLEYGLDFEKEAMENKHE